jgi:hypothetical protein
LKTPFIKFQPVLVVQKIDRSKRKESQTPARSLQNDRKIESERNNKKKKKIEKEKY